MADARAPGDAQLGPDEGGERMVKYSIDNWIMMGKHMGKYMGKYWKNMETTVKYEGNLRGKYRKTLG